MPTQLETQREVLSALSDLSGIAVTLIEQLAMRVLSNSEKFISSSLESPGLGTQQFGFILLQENVNTDEEGYEHGYSVIYDTIKQQLELGVFSKIYIISNKYLSKGLKLRLQKDLNTSLLDYWDRDELIRRINLLYPDYWRHTDQELIVYEKTYSSDLYDDWSFGRIKQFKSSYEKLYTIFIEPKIFQKVRDKESANLAFVPSNIDKIKLINNPVIIEGAPGSGKTRLIREIGHAYIKENPTKTGKKYLPVFLSVTKLVDTKDSAGKISLNAAVLSKLGQLYQSSSIDEILERYILVVLLDTIDDLDAIAQKGVLKEASSLVKKGAKFVLGTRSLPSDIEGIDLLERHEEFAIQKFSSKQVKQFLSKYFSSNANHADDLIQSLQENKILERLPITPLNLSLISILYEENNFEIPATITDIYDNFNNLLLGRATVDSRLQFFDINIKERVLSKYALELLERNSDKSMTKDEFLKYFQEFFEPIAETIKIDLLPVLLDHLIYNTGILNLEEDKYVKFRHDSYLEYYASREIFYYRRPEYEPKLVDNFLDLSWQYTSIFYAGRSKDASLFLQNIISRAAKASTAAEAWKGISGLGYISQALYLTTNVVRKEAVNTALDLSVLALYGMKLLGANDAAFFKTLTLPLVTIITSMWFMDSFNSITVRGPLSSVFEDIFAKFIADESLDSASPKLSEDVRNNYAFKLFSLALTMSNRRLDDTSKMERLLFDTKLLNDPLYKDLLAFGTEVASSKELYRLKESALKPKFSKKDKREFYIPNSIVSVISKKPAGFLRFTEYDRIQPLRKIRIYTEGKTDAQIIEHAFNVLTGQIPYWNIKQVGAADGKGSGAHALSALLTTSHNLLDSDDEIIIGVFDNDEKGCQEFNGIDKDFLLWNGSSRVKKHTNYNVFALKLPVPPEKEYYIQEEQRYNLFAIEHYFTEEFLNSNNMLEASPILGTHKIKSSRKTKFSKEVLNNSSKDVFKDFVFLFRELDSIAGRNDIEYDVS